MVIFISIVSTLKFCFQLLRNEDIFQKKKIKVKEALSTHAGARSFFVQGMLLKRRARTGNGERGTGNVERENDK